MPLIPRCNIDELLAIEAAPPTPSSLQSKSSRRSKSASAGSCLIKSSPLPPIPSNSAWTDADDTSTSAVVSGRPSSSHVTRSSWSSPCQSTDEPPADSFFMTEVLALNASSYSVFIQC